MPRLATVLGLGVLGGCAEVEQDRAPGMDAPDPGRLRGVLTMVDAVPPSASAYVVLTLMDAVPGGRARLERRWRLDGASASLSFDLTAPPGIAAATPPLRLRAALVVDGRPTQVSAWMSASASGTPHELAMRPSPDGAFAARLVCGADTARVDFDPQAITLAVAGRSFPLVPAPAASGARYLAASDTSTSAWNRGAVTTVTVEGRALPVCATREALSGTFRARGNEPFWSLVLTGGDMTFSTPDGGAVSATAWRTEGAPPVTTHASEGEGPSIAAEVRHAPCADSMSGMPFPTTVTLLVDGRVYEGCGGEPVELLLGAAWVVASVGARPVTTVQPPPSISFFPDGTVSGSTSCNEYRGQFVLSGEGLSLSPLAATRRACAPEVMQLESAFLAALAAAGRFEIGANGTLRLIGAGAESIVAGR